MDGNLGEKVESRVRPVSYMCVHRSQFRRRSSKLDQMTYRAKVGVSTPSLSSSSRPLLTTMVPQRLVDDFHQASIELLESDWLKLNDTADDLDCEYPRFL